MADTIEHNLKERPIWRVLRRKHSDEYFTGTGWSKNLGEARNFPSSIAAAQSCAHHSLSGVELVLRIDGANADLYRTDLK